MTGGEHGFVTVVFVIMFFASVYVAWGAVNRRPPS